VTRSRLGTPFVALVLIGATACGATYHPRPGPRIVEVNRELFRDGRRFPIGMLGGGAAEVVAGDPRALEYAERKRSLARTGWLAYGLGLLTLVAGSIGAAALPEGVRTPVFVSAWGLGVGACTLGIYWDIKGNAAMRDAVNVYNDDLDAVRMAVPPTVAPAGSP
jgi:hypothetical protein